MPDVLPKKREKPNPDITTQSVIKHALRRLWLQSRERRAALKRDGYTCQTCHRKQSKAKGREFAVEVDHLDGEIDWKVIVEFLRRTLLVPHDRLETICKEDHDKVTEARRLAGWKV